MLTGLAYNAALTNQNVTIGSVSVTGRTQNAAVAILNTDKVGHSLSLDLEPCRDSGQRTVGITETQVLRMTIGNVTAVPLAPVGVITGRKMAPGIRNGVLTMIGTTINTKNGNVRLGKRIPRMTGRKSHGGLRKPGRRPMASRSPKVHSSDPGTSMVKHKAALNLLLQMKAPSLRKR